MPDILYFTLSLKALFTIIQCITIFFLLPCSYRVKTISNAMKISTDEVLRNIVLLPKLKKIIISRIK